MLPISRIRMMSLLIFIVFVIVIPLPSLPIGPNNLESVLKNHVSVRPCQEIHWTVNGTLGCNGWYVSPLTLSCTYDYDNITAVHYKYTGTNWTVYNDPFTIYTQGNISFQYYTVDRNGTVSPTLCFCLHIDYTPPQPNVSRDGRKIIVTTGDNDSGLDRAEFWVGPYLQFTQVFADPSGQQTAIWIISPLPLINVTITVIVYDLACNKYSYNYTTSSLSLTQQATHQPHSYQSINGSPPTKPELTGETHCKVGVYYNYTMMSVDPDGDQIFYDVVTMDNGVVLKWNLGPYPSGYTAVYKRSWGIGPNTLWVYARDTTGLTSNGAHLNIVMSKEVSHQNFILQLLDWFPHTFPLLRLLLDHRNE